MPREAKYYGTLMNYSPSQAFYKTYPLVHRQYRVVIKAHSFAEANRISEEITGHKVFHKSYTSETGNEKEITLCDMHGAIIATDYLHTNYISLIDAVNMK